MFYLFIKTLISASIIVAISEIGKRSTLGGAILASLPLTSMLAMIWLYRETHDINMVIQLSNSIFWLILPSVTLFITLPILLIHLKNFYLALFIATIATMIMYLVMIMVLAKLGIRL